jgi:hypothetical protein
VESNFDKYVMGQTMGKFSIISVHQWLEHLLALSLRVVIPNPDPIFRDRGIGFALLIALCEAHQIIESPLAEVLRKVNSLRNKCAHELTFNPREPDWDALRVAIDRVVGPADDDEASSLRRLADFVEQKAIAVGAIVA